MPDAPRELLIVLESRTASETLARLRAVASVTQVFPPRLALVQAGPDAMTRVVRIHGVLHVLDGPARKLPADLTPAERIFAAAWQARQQPKTRAGDGLPWDAPGFEPPGPPGG
jgi:hypothetical protein